MYRLISSDKLPLTLLAIIVICTTLFPGDAPWIFDEPILMNGALLYNAKPSHLGPITLPFTPAVTGLQGTRGVRYGPLAAWIDQVFLVFTHDPVPMIAIRAAVFSAANAIALYWLCRTLKFSPWLAVIVMCSPWLWFYARQLWDNSLCIPFSALLIAAYADFLVRRRGSSLLLAVFCSLMLLLLHFMSLTIVGAFVIHLLVFERGSLWKYKWAVASIILVVGAISWPYWNFLAHNFRRDIPPDSSSIQGWFYPLLGAHHLTAVGLENIFGADWPSNTLLAFAPSISRILGYSFVWLGMALASEPLLSREKVRGPNQIFIVAFLAVIFQCIVDGVQHVSNGPQYYNATWIIFALFALFAVNLLFNLMGDAVKRATIAIAAIYGASLLFTTASLAITIHRNSGIRSDNYGTTLANQIAAVREIHHYSPDSPREIEVPQWAAHPIALEALEKLFPPASSPAGAATLVVTYRDRFSDDAAIAVIPQSPQSPASLP